MQGKADISIKRDCHNRQTIDYYQQSPMRLFLPNSHGEDATEIVLANTSGGIVGGDKLEVNVNVSRNTSAVATSQAAEKAYRSTGADTRISTSLNVGSMSSLKWIPQETILFDGVRLRRRTSIDVESGSKILAGEMLVFGRTARGESLTYGLVHDEWRVHYDGKLMWADNLHLTGDILTQMASPVGFNRSKAIATLVYVADDAPEKIDIAKSLIQSKECWTGATLIGNVIIARWLGRDTAALRQEYLNFTESFSAIIDSSPTKLPVVMTV